MILGLAAAPLIIGFTVVVALLIVAVDALIVLYLRRQGFRVSANPPSSPVDHQFTPSRSQVFRGGMRRRWVGTRWASVVLDEQWARLSGTSLVEVPPVWVERRHVTQVRPIRSPLASGVRFDSSDGRYDGVIFWGGPALVASLQRFGWPVDT